MTDQRKVRMPATGDRLSSLPDEIITHILSFLKTKHAVRTAVLRRRWKDLWTRVPNLDFDNRLASNQLSSRSDGIRELEFSRFVDRVLSQHRNLNSVRRFRLRFEISRCNWNLRPDFLFKRESVFGSQVEEIDVWVAGLTENGDPIWWLPENFYTLENLKVVRLNNVMMGSNSNPSWSVSLPSVKILQLREVMFADFESLSKLISGCPALETLHLDSCDSQLAGNWNYKLIASVPSLRYLGLYRGSVLDDYLCDIAIEAPNLEHLVLQGFVDLRFLGTSPLPRLQSARVVVAEGLCSTYHQVMGLLTQISNAKEMFIAWTTLQYLSGVDDLRLPVFPNLTHLTIQPTSSSCILHSILHSASKLQALVIDLGFADDPMKWEESEPACPPKCLLSSLEEIKIKQLAADEDDIKMVEYLLKAGAVLKKVDLHALDCIDDEQWRELESLLERLPKSSSTCDACLLPCDGEIDICFSRKVTHNRLTLSSTEMAKWTSTKTGSHC